MIDEIFDDDVRVLRSTLREDAPGIERVADAVSIRRRRRSSAGRGRVRASVEAAAIRAIAVEVEAAPVSTWTPETEAMADRSRLSAFLLGGGRRTAQPGLPARDALREGDVFWLILPGEVSASLASAEERPLDAVETATLLDELDEAEIAVWDVTAASRQVMKRRYGDAAFARSDERSTAASDRSAEPPPDG